MQLDDVRIPSAVANYYNEHWNIIQFCNRANDVITVSYQNGSYPEMNVKFQPDSVEAQQIRDIVRSAVNNRMAECRKFDVGYRLRQAKRVIESLEKAIHEE